MKTSFSPRDHSSAGHALLMVMCITVVTMIMLAATMSTLSSVYNMVSSILTRDIYQGWIRPDHSIDICGAKETKIP